MIREDLLTLLPYVTLLLPVGLLFRSSRRCSLKRSRSRIELDTFPASPKRGRPPTYNWAVTFCSLGGCRASVIPA